MFIEHYWLQLEPYTPAWFFYDGDDADDPDSEGSAVSEKWKFGEKYWKERENGFQHVKFEPIWWFETDDILQLDAFYSNFNLVILKLIINQRYYYVFLCRL